MSKIESYLANDKDWDSAKLGNDEKYVKVADTKTNVELDDALDLQMISIRLQKKMIEDLKLIALAHGIGYQPLIRDVLSRFVTYEVKQIIRDTIERKELEERQCMEERKRDRARAKKAA